MAWWRALRETARSGLRVERTRLEPLPALRAAAGVAIVIGTVSWWLGPAAAASAAFGAFASGNATFQRSWRSRPVLALAAGAALAVSTFVSYLAASHTAAFTVLIAAWAFLAGMAWALGPTAGVVASLTVAVMLVVVTLPTSVPQAAGHAAVIAYGGVVQAALIVLFPVRRWGRHRDALADAFAAEADYARRLRHDPVASFDFQPLMTARSAAELTARQARRRPPELRGKRNLAERVRPLLASLADPAVGAAETGPQRDRTRELLGLAADVLDAVAHAVRRAEPVTVPDRARALLAEAPEPPGELTGPARRTAARLLGLLAEAVESADAEDGSVSGPSGHLRRPPLTQLAPLAARSVRRETRRDSPVCRHAVRLSGVTAAGHLLATALPLGHPYWAPLASAMVLRPDFAQTYSRAVGRFAGTLAGVAVATAVIQLAHPGRALSAALAVLSIGGMYLLLRTAYVAAQTCVSAYVVFLLGMGGERWVSTVPERVLLTLLGGLLAMAAYAVFPAWETPRLRDRLAERIVATGRYAAAVFQAAAEPNRHNRRALRDALLDARAAALTFDQAVARADAEPVRHRGLSRRTVDRADLALASLGRVPMLLEAHLPPPGGEPVEHAGPFASALRRTTEDLAAALRARRTPDPEPLRAALAAWPAPKRSLTRRGAELMSEAVEELAEALTPRRATGPRGESARSRRHGRRRRRHPGKR
jgi:uncharacterized membrane protein YccC